MHVVMTTDTTRQDMVLHQPCSKCNGQGIPAWLLGHVLDAQCQPRAASALRAPRGPPHAKFCIVIGSPRYYMPHCGGSQRTLPTVTGVSWPLAPLRPRRPTAVKRSSKAPPQGVRRRQPPRCAPAVPAEAADCQDPARSWLGGRGVAKRALSTRRAEGEGGHACVETSGALRPAHAGTRGASSRRDAPCHSRRSMRAACARLSTLSPKSGSAEGVVVMRPTLRATVGPPPDRHECGSDPARTNGSTRVRQRAGSLPARVDPLVGPRSP